MTPIMRFSNNYVIYPKHEFPILKSATLHQKAWPIMIAKVQPNVSTSEKNPMTKERLGEV
jgi:hypothetical protein